MRPDDIDVEYVTDVVLFSGGWESAACAVIAQREVPDQCVALMHANYAQEYVAQERLAVHRIASKLHLETALFISGIPNMPCVQGMYLNRNRTFIQHARSLFPNAVTLWFGSRCPHPIFDRYGDSNPKFARQAAHDAGFLRAKLPCSGHTKRWVRNIVTRAGITEEDVFSSEGWVYAT